MELVHLLLTLRGPVWRVRILSGGTISWKCYRAEDYPTPEAVARRCAEGLVSGHENDKHDQPHGNGEEKLFSMAHLFGFGGSAGGGWKLPLVNEPP